MDQRANGTPKVAGVSHAIRLTATITLGRQAGWAPAAWLFLQPCKAVADKPLAPLADDLARCVEPGSNLVVAQAGGRPQDDLGANDVTIRRRISTRSRLQFAPLPRGEHNNEGTVSWQRLALRCRSERTESADDLSLQLRHRMYEMFH